LKRKDFQNLALIRLEEAKVLLDNNQYSGAYYLSGYVVECALKACIAKLTQQYDFPEKKIVDDSHTHDLTKLVRSAGLEVPLQNRRSDPDFDPKWTEVKDWSEKSRYKEHTEQNARDIYLAITDPNHGVLQWLQQHW
jgi:HEPN domain-containing protein